MVDGLIIDPDILVFILDEIVGIDAVDGGDVVLHHFHLVIFWPLLLEIFSVYRHSRPAWYFESYVLRFSVGGNMHCIGKYLHLVWKYSALEAIRKRI